MDDDIQKMMANAPREHAARFADIVDLTDAFCDAHLKAEYKEL